MRSRTAPLLAATAAFTVSLTGLSGLSGIAAFGVAAAAEAEICRIPEVVVVDEVEKKPRRVPNIEPTTWKRLQQAYELITAEQYAEGVEVLETMIPRDGRRSRYNAAEMGQVHNLLGNAYWELGRGDKTIEHYEKVLDQVPQIAEATELLMLFQLSKIYFMQAQEKKEDQEQLANEWYRRSLARMGEWIDKNNDPGPEPYFFIGQIYYHLDDFDRGIRCLETTVHVAGERGITVKEPWWQMLKFMYYEQENLRKVLEISEILVRDYPKREYWVTLASVHGELGEEDKQLWVLEAAHVGGYLNKEVDLRTYGALLVQDGVPNRASKYLETGFDDEIIERTPRNLQLWGQALQISQEIDRAIEVFEESGEIEPDGKTFDLLAALYLDRDKFAECRVAARKALDAGGLTNPLRTQLNLASCEFYLGNLTAARKEFSDVRRKARQDREGNLETQAGTWIQYIDSESKRRDELARHGLSG